MPSAVERTQRAAGLDGLRAIAALSVLLFHIWLYGFDNPSAVARVSVFDKAMFEMRLGLVFFFVLSGYLLYRSFARAALGEGSDRVSVRRYARRRLARIVPAYWLATVGAIALLWGGAGTPGIRLPPADKLPLYFVFGQNFSLDTIMRLNPVTWTLCVEMAFYILLPLIGWAAWRIGPSRTVLQALLVGSLFVVGVGWNQLAHDGAWNILLTKMLPPFLPYFACGMLLALWSERRRVRGGDALSSLATWSLVVGGFLLVVVDAYWHETGGPRAVNAPLAVFADIPAAVGFALVVGAAVAGTGLSVRWMRVRPLAWIGLVSYGVYMWHLPILLFMRRVDVWPEEFFVRALVLLVPTLLVAALSWYLVERPLIRWAHAPRGARERAAAEPEPPTAKPVRDRAPAAREPAFESHAAP